MSAATSPTAPSFTTLESRAILLPRADVDTDQIIPARFLKITDKAGLADKLFNDWRYLEGGAPNPDFPLNRPDAKGAQILIAGPNFGCGSSREHAPWSLVAWGLRAVIAPSFADIFRGNSLKNGLLPIALEPAAYTALLETVSKNPQTAIKIDLEAQMVTWPGHAAAAFKVDPFARKCLLAGVDELGYLLSFHKQVEAYEQRRK